jgi:hypothetical protein
MLTNIPRNSDENKTQSLLALLVELLVAPENKKKYKMIVYFRNLPQHHCKSLMQASKWTCC